MSFASNLLGAMVGGALEYVALLTGYQALLVVIGGIYVLAVLFQSRWRVFADRALIERRPSTAAVAAAALE